MRTLLLMCLFLISTQISYSQQIRISGFIRDHASGEKLVNANIYSIATHTGTISNNEGYFSLALKESNAHLVISYIGYKSKEVRFNVKRDTMVVITLDSDLLLSEIKVTANRYNKISSHLITDIPLQQIKMAPAMLGEVDVIKTLQLLPGVKNTRAGFSGFVVRGGSPDQNLILLDNIPIYNSSHYYGLFSVINENSLQSVRFMKGAIPAKYGGRLSSVVDITLKEGNQNKSEREISLGLMSSSFMLNGPIKKGKTTFSISGRRSMIDLLMLPYFLVSNKPKEGYYFGDLSAKLVHSFSSKDKVSLSYFTSEDERFNNSNFREYEHNGNKIKMSRDQGYKWGNHIASVKWNRIQNAKLSFNTSVYLSDFFMERHVNDKMETQEKVFRTESSFESSIRDMGIRTDWQYFPKNLHQLNFGVAATNHQFKPGITVFYDKNIETGETVNNSIGDLPADFLELTGYVDYDFRVVRFLTLNAGFRLTSINLPDNNFLIPEPRFSGTLHISEGANLTTYYMKTSQYFHLLRSSLLDLPTDLWLPASADFPVEKAQQVGFEASYQTMSGLEFSIAGYYKNMDNLLEYRDGSSIFSTKSEWKEVAESGKGSAHGGEFFFHKKEGRLNGWVSYTLSWATRQFDKINNDREFYSSFDKRHDLSLVANYQLNKRWNIAANWLFNTGTPYNMPEHFRAGGRIWFPGTGLENSLARIDQVLVYNQRNNYRLPAYHRLDVGLHFNKPCKKHPKREQIWSVSIFNVYNRHNAFNRYYNQSYYGEASLFGIMPSISYKLKF